MPSCGTRAVAAALTVAGAVRLGLVARKSDPSGADQQVLGINQRRRAGISNMATAMIERGQIVVEMTTHFDFAADRAEIFAVVNDGDPSRDRVALAFS